MRSPFRSTGRPHGSAHSVRTTAIAALTVALLASVAIAAAPSLPRRSKARRLDVQTLDVAQKIDINMLYNLASGTPYTPSVVYDEASLAATAPTAAGALNSRYGPWTQSLDLKLQRGFGYAGLKMSAYLWALNVLDTNNAVGVYTSTGSPTTTSFLNTPAGADARSKLASEGINIDQAYGLAMQNAALYTNPRAVRLGVRVGF